MSLCIYLRTSLYYLYLYIYLSCISLPIEPTFPPFLYRYMYVSFIYLIMCLYFCHSICLSLYVCLPIHSSIYSFVCLPFSPYMCTHPSAHCHHYQPPLPLPTPITSTLPSSSTTTITAATVSLRQQGCVHHYAAPRLQMVLPLRPIVEVVVVVV